MTLLLLSISMCGQLLKKIYHSNCMYKIIADNISRGREREKQWERERECERERAREGDITN